MFDKQSWEKSHWKNGLRKTVWEERLLRKLDCRLGNTGLGIAELKFIKADL